MILVYTHKITPRLTYIFRQIFTRILQVEVSFTTKVDEFVAHNGPKITYSNHPLGKEFFIRSHTLLFRQGVGNPEVDMKDWEGVPSFFYMGEQSGIPFDIFAASFYLLTRYEEYHPYVPDLYSRFSADQSLYDKQKALTMPVVDIWAFRLRDRLKERFPDYVFPDRVFSTSYLIDVTEAYAYRHKGILRNVGGMLRDLSRLQLRKFFTRISVLLHLRPDPYCIYQELLEYLKKSNQEVIFFFLFSEFNMFDTNISPRNRSYRLLIKRIIDYKPFGQLFSYYTVNDAEVMENEKNRLEELVIRLVTNSRQHRYRLEIPKTYRQLVELGIEDDYSMGYENVPGFRAGTCTPFYFYDLDFEIQTPLRVHPVAVTDRALMESMGLTPREAALHLEELVHRVRQVNGHFVLSVRNAMLSDEYPAWKKFFYRYLNRKILTDE